MIADFRLAIVDCRKAKLGRESVNFGHGEVD